MCQLSKTSLKCESIVHSCICAHATPSPPVWAGTANLGRNNIVALENFKNFFRNYEPKKQSFSSEVAIFNAKIFNVTSNGAI